MNIKIKRALISVYDKKGVSAFGTFLQKEFGVEILSTGGTARHLREAGLEVKDVAEFTRFPEGLDGRVKTLHPRVHGGLLYIRNNDEHELWIKEHGIEPIDMVVINLYPFSETVAKPDVTEEDAIEQIDIGGPAMLRSAAKNFASVTVVSNPDQYVTVQNQMALHNGCVSLKVRRLLMQEAFSATSHYDTQISAYFEAQDRVSRV